eukprot:2966067-Amphidinium_carterae.1
MLAALVSEVTSRLNNAPHREHSDQHWALTEQLPFEGGVSNPPQTQLLQSCRVIRANTSTAIPEN